MFGWLSGSRRVSFVVAGVQKGGTTALFENLKQHPKLNMPRRKECHYFNSDGYFMRPDKGVRAYHAMFPRLRRGQIRGEATPGYLYCVEAPARMADYNPAMRVIVLLRDPIARAYSHWVMERHRGLEALDFRDAIRAEPARLRMQPQHPVYSYVNRGRYAEQLCRLWERIPREQTLVLRSDCLLQKPQETVARVCRFLDVDPLADDKVIRTPVFAQSYDKSIDAETRRCLLATLEPDVRSLESLLGWDLGDWLRI